MSIDAVIGVAPDPPQGETLGSSREGRTIVGHRIGSGPIGVSLIGGCHADEPVGPWLLDRLVTHLASLPGDAPARRRFTWWIVPHVNPDGEVRNAGWTAPLAGRLARALPSPACEATPHEGRSSHRQPPAELAADPALYAAHVVRELPGDDVEFGFPRSASDGDARPETRAVAAWWRSAGKPFDLHVSLHGMGAARGPWFLVEGTWRERAAPLIEACRRAVRDMGYRLHDDARTGEKGFARIAEGFSTRPDSRAMKAFFDARGESDIAARFRPSSMETIRSLGGDPLTLVTEMPLFVVERRPPRTSAVDIVASGGAAPMPILDQWRLQWIFIEAGIALVRPPRTENAS